MDYNTAEKYEEEKYDKAEAESILNQLIWVYENIVEHKERKLQKFPVIQVLRKILPKEITAFKMGLNTYSAEKNPKETEEFYRRLSVIQKSVFELLDSQFVFNIRKSIVWIIDVYSRDEMKFRTTSLYYQSPLLALNLNRVLTEQVPQLNGETHLMMYLNGELEEISKKDPIERTALLIGLVCGVVGIVLLLGGMLLRLMAVESSGWFILTLGIALIGIAILLSVQSVLGMIDNRRRQRVYMETLKRNLENLEPRN